MSLDGVPANISARGVEKAVEYLLRVHTIDFEHTSTNQAPILLMFIGGQDRLIEVQVEGLSRGLKIKGHP